MSVIRIGVIGYGVRIDMLMDQLSDLYAEAKVVAVADKNQSRVKALMKKSDSAEVQHQMEIDKIDGLLRKCSMNPDEINFYEDAEEMQMCIRDRVHQELNQCLERNVVDNLFLGRYPKNSMGIVDEGRMKKEASELFRKLGMTVDLSQSMRHMSVSQRQMCEIAKAISYNSKVIVLDAVSYTHLS